MNRVILFFAFLSILMVSSCIEDDILQDFVQPEIRIVNTVDTLGVDSTFLFDGRFFNNIGQDEIVDIVWESTDESIATIDGNGNATGVSEGNVTISASFTDADQNLATAESSFNVGMAILPPPEMEELRTIDGVIRTTTTYTLEGDFKFIETENGITIEVASNYEASDGLPGLFIYLSNNINSIANAFEIGPVETFEGEHSYTVENVDFQEYSSIVYFCKPFNIKVGDAALDF